MKKGDPFSLGADSRDLVDDSHARLTAFFQHSIQIVDGEADVVDARAALRYESSNRRIVLSRLQKLDKGVSGGYGSDARPVRIGDLSLR